jgi:acyl-CoA synthetase (NDP forming)
MSKTEALQRLLHPTSIAIIGVSQDFTSIGGKPLKNLIHHQFAGNIYPVNPKYKELGGYTCYPSILDVPGQVDVALIAVSQARILQVIKDCAQKQIRHVIMFGSGFAEVGEEGKRLQDELLALTKEHAMNVIGPNCIGVLNARDQLPLGFATSFESNNGFLAGPVGLASQSGAHGFSIFGLAQEEGVGFSYIVNTGNQMDITTLDCIEFMLHDDNTKVIASYMEGIPDGKQFIRLACKAKELGKPIVIIKAGRSEVGRQAALSHTASLAGSEETFQAVAKQYGIIQADDIDEMVDTIKIFSRGKQARGPRVACVTSSGAAGIAIADHSEALGLELVRLSKETKAKIETIIPSYGSALNPIDITAQALKEQHIFSDTLEVLAQDDQVDVIVVQTTFGGALAVKICETLVEIDKRTTKPIVVTLTGTQEMTGDARSILQQAAVPVYQTSRKTMTAIRNLVQFSQFYSSEIKYEQRTSRDEGRSSQIESGVWTEEKVKQQLSALGLRVPKGTIVRNTEHLHEIIEEVSYPVVCKVISDDILHKTEAGGVIVGIKNDSELIEAYGKIIDSVHQSNPEARIKGLLVEEMIEDKGVEMFIGIKEDPQFGPFIVSGLGGIFVEVFKDVSIRHAPIDLDEAYVMLKELKGYALLEGVRGMKRRDIDAFAQALVKISDFAYEHKESIKEMDINPVIVLEDGKGVVVLDGLVVWKENGI